jgi:hypothetical protein
MTQVGATYTVSIGEHKNHALELDLSELGKKFKYLVPFHIFYCSQRLVLAEGKRTLYRRDIMVWKR